MKAFFIVGVQRSGTTLLSVMLGKHPSILMEQRVISFRMITCFKNLYDLLPLNIHHDKKAFTAWLIKNDDKGRLAELIDYQNIGQYNNIRELIQGSIKKKLSKHGKLIWGDKSPNLQHYLSDLLLLMPDAKFLHIIRDGRANAYSMSTRSYRNIYLSAQQWVDGNIFGIVNQQILGHEKYKIIHYEDLLMNPEKEAREVCDFLEIPFSTEMLDLSSKQLDPKNSYVKNYFDHSKIDKWKEQLSDKQVSRIECIQGPLLKELGYDLVTSPKNLQFKPLSLRRQLWYNQQGRFKQLFQSKIVGMKGKEIVELEIPFKNRIYTFLRFLCQDLLARPIFKSIFSRVFYKEKYYQEEKKSLKERT